jgi:gamma-glutamyltranspeptidase / glutathione hydrolase
MNPVSSVYRQCVLGLGLASLLSICAPNTAHAEAAVASPDAYGASTAKLILAQGGNAVDAAVAMAFTLAVTFPEAGNLGGGGFATVWFKGQSYFVDYREVAPLRASRDMYLDAHHEVIDGLSTTGALAAAVPGTVKGLWELHQRFGKLSWRADLAPAVRLASDGFKVSPELASAAADTSEDLHGKTNFQATYGRMRAEQVFKQPELAQVLTRIQKLGPRDFYDGVTAHLLTKDIQQQGGILSLKDLHSYQVHWRTPLLGHYAGYEVITAPPPSSGGIALLTMLGMKQELASAFTGVKHNSADYVHLIAEIEKRVFADRGEVLGDPDFYPVPVAQLLNPQYIAQRAQGISLSVLTPTSEVKPGISVHHNTTHFSVVDHDGNAVSNTYTLNDEFGARTVSAHTGILLNNEMDDFSIKPGVPNIYGVIGGEANAIAPKKHPLSSMTPTILVKDGQPVMIVGTPGGSRIFTSVFQVITNWQDFKMPLKDAVSAVRFHHQLLPENLIFEEPYGTLDSATKAQLSARGYLFENQGWNGDIEAIAWQDGHWAAMSDPRGRGVAMTIQK